MPRYEMDDGTILNTDLAVESWKELTFFDGRNHISVSTGSQWLHETLYLSSKGRYYLVKESDYKGTLPCAVLLGEPEAARWLLANGRDIPEALKPFAVDIEE